MNLSLSCATIIYFIFSLFMQLLFGYCTHHSEQKKLHKIATCRRGFLACQHGLPIHLAIGGRSRVGGWSFVVSSICQKCRAIVRQATHLKEKNAQQVRSLLNHHRLSSIVWRDSRSSMCAMKLQVISAISFTAQSRAPFSMDCTIQLRKNFNWHLHKGKVSECCEWQTNEPTPDQTTSRQRLSVHQSSQWPTNCETERHACLVVSPPAHSLASQ